MDYKAVIKDAWILAKEDRRLFWWWAFVPSIITIIYGVGAFLYQVLAMRYAPVLGTSDKSFMSMLGELAMQFLNTNTSIGIVFIVITAVFILIYLTYPTFCQASLIQLIARIRNKQEVNMVDGITYGALGFLKLFEYHLVIKFFSFINLIVWAMFILRNFGMDAFTFFIIPLSFFAIIVFIVMLFLTYADFYIVIDDMGVIKSIGRSMRLVVRQWRHTLLILILMMIISLRIILNIVLVLLVPTLIFMAFGAMAALTLAKIGMVIGAVVGLAALFFAAYLTGVLEVFANAVWVFSFLELTEAGETHARAKGIDARGQVIVEEATEETPPQEER